MSHKPRRVDKHKRKPMPNFGGLSSVLRKYWDPSKSTRDNYREIGLVSQLNGYTKAIVKEEDPLELYHNPEDPFNEDCPIDFSEALPGGKPSADGKVSYEATTDPEELAKLKRSIPAGYGIIERDAEGNIINVIVPDAMDGVNEPEPAEAKTEAVQELEALAGIRYEKVNKPSEDSQVYLQRLLDKHGGNLHKMHMDLKLNWLQYTPGQLRKRFIRFKPFLTYPPGVVIE
ncbi:Nucleolar protein 16 [Tieghemiomyces parasiticus]|uniref:Nucleolar protein 16 n=1 Tax=Tieghemiomyces parasiticus TaxID=78921 RepID=A0A9W7ZQP0_9FUNG|nr:Nucleolar protein 16 [Tieghemiomyces parasiticus]